MTGWFRDGTCRTDRRDSGRHLVCAKMTEGFSSSPRGGGMTSVRPVRTTDFRDSNQVTVGVSVQCGGPKRCVGQAPPVVLAATHKAAVRYVELASLKSNAVDGRQTANPTQETPTGKMSVDGK